MRAPAGVALADAAIVPADYRGASSVAGIRRRSSSSHAVACLSLGARQSERGDSEPPEPTFGALGIAERLNWLVWKKR